MTCEGDVPRDITLNNVPTKGGGTSFDVLLFYDSYQVKRVGDKE